MKNLIHGAMYLCMYKNKERFLEWCKIKKVFKLGVQHIKNKEIQKIIRIVGYTHRTPYIAKDKLIAGREYMCKARNFKIGTWTGERFAYNREKYNAKFIDYEYHWDDGPPYGTVKPIIQH